MNVILAVSDLHVVTRPSDIDVRPSLSLVADASAKTMSTVRLATNTTSLHSRGHREMLVQTRFLLGVESLSVVVGAAVLPPDK